MDYIPSNNHGDYISHSEDYLMHYGVKGMKWKDHDYVEDIQTGARKVAGNVKSKIKQLKKFVGKVGAKAKGKVIEKVDPKLREYDYVKNHKVNEERDKREANMKLSQAKTKEKLHPNMSDREKIQAAKLGARAGILNARAENSEKYPASWRTRQRSYQHINKKADEYVKRATDAVAKNYLNVGIFDASQNAKHREASEHQGHWDAQIAIERNKKRLKTIKRLESQARKKSYSGEASPNALKKRKINK